MTTTDEFTRGVDWGKFTANAFDEDIRSDGARSSVLMAVIDHLNRRPDPALMEAMTDAWFAYQCHGYLKRGEVCQDCGTINPGEDT